MSLLYLCKLFFTVKYLTFGQVLYRLIYRFSSRVKLIAFGDAVCRDWPVLWQAPKSNKISTKDAINFYFIGERGCVLKVDDWHCDRFSMLWRYNLHYLDALNEGYVGSRMAVAYDLLGRWVAANPAACGIGWDPYPLSIRIVNIIKFLGGQESPNSKWLISLSEQASVLGQRIERHILGNHIFANGKALVFSGAYLSGSDADRWLKKGLKILDREIKEQFLEDGAHFELSPMYHSTLLWDMCDLVNLAERANLPQLSARLSEWRLVVVRGLQWLRSMQHPDGGIPFFNDAAFGIAPTLADLEDYASRLEGCSPVPDVGKDNFGAHYHAQSGYASIDLGDGNKTLLDLARVGPDYQPGHAHADTLSFELSLFGKRIFVNSGTSQYGDDAERHRQRSTSAHNTVEVDGENSSEVWSGFRVARRAYPVLELFDNQSDKILIRASHTGYLRLKGRVLHRREWLFESGHIELLDKVEGEHEVAVARLYVHPKIRFIEEQRRFIARLEGGGYVVVEFKGGESSRLVRSSWHPEFGKKIENQCIESVFRNGSLTTHIYWGASV